MTTILTAPLTGPDWRAPFDAAGFKLPKTINMKHCKPTPDGLLITLPAKKIGVKNGWSLNIGLPEPKMVISASLEVTYLRDFIFGHGGKGLGPGFDTHKWGGSYTGGNGPKKDGDFSVRWMHWREEEEGDGDFAEICAYIYRKSQRGKTGDYGHTTRAIAAGETNFFKITVDGSGWAHWWRDGEPIWSERLCSGPQKPVRQVCLDYFLGGNPKDVKKWSVKSAGPVLVRNLKVGCVTP